MEQHVISIRKVARMTEHLAAHVFTQGVEALKHSPLIERNRDEWMLDHIGELEFTNTSVSCIYNHSQTSKSKSAAKSGWVNGSWYTGNGDYLAIMQDLKKRLLNTPELKDLFGDIRAAKLIQLNGQEIGIE